MYGGDYILQVELMTDMDYLNCNDKIARLIKTPHGSGVDNNHVSLVIRYGTWTIYFHTERGDENLFSGVIIYTRSPVNTRIYHYKYVDAY